MEDDNLLERARLRFNLTAAALESVTTLCREQQLGASEALLQLGIISRRQLSDLVSEPVAPQLRDTQEFDSSLLHGLETPVALSPAD